LDRDQVNRKAAVLIVGNVDASHLVGSEITGPVDFSVFDEPPASGARLCV
jgi:hypothetical protein